MGDLVTVEYAHSAPGIEVKTPAEGFCTDDTTESRCLTCEGAGKVCAKSKQSKANCKAFHWLGIWCDSGTNKLIPCPECAPPAPPAQAQDAVESDLSETGSRYSADTQPSQATRTFSQATEYTQLSSTGTTVERQRANTFGAALDAFGREDQANLDDAGDEIMRQGSPSSSTIP